MGEGSRVAEVGMLGSRVFWARGEEARFKV